jgi:hypothetical protein
MLKKMLKTVAVLFAAVFLFACGESKPPEARSREHKCWRRDSQ